MKRTTLILALTGMVIAQAAAAITMDLVYVGDIGNPNDITGYGSVGYGYSIGKYEVTLNQYSEFLNAVAATDTYGVYNPYVQSDWATARQIRGIARSGESGSYSYSVIGSGNRPVTWVGWFGAARFCNWLQNGQPTGAQGPGTTETGAYTLNGATSGIFMRNENVTYGLPSENEWYKAAYYDPTMNSGNGGYWLYPTRSNVQPNSRNGSATDPNSANYYYDDGIANGYNGGYAVNNSTTPPYDNVLTDVGAFSLTASAYGTFDQAGNVSELNDAVIGSARGVRGGSWGGALSFLWAWGRLSQDPSVPSGNGFRVVMIPEPSAIALLALGGAALVQRRRGRR